MEDERWVIFDLDGTLANLTHRLPFIKCKNPDWTEFNLACEDDQPIVEMIEMVNLLDCAGYSIAIITGRNDMVREQTHAWLARWRVRFSELHMRNDGDSQPDETLKQRIYFENFYKRNVVWVFDDRQRVVDMWRKLDLRCCQVAKGNF